MLSKGAVDESVADAKMQARPQSQVKAEDWTFKAEDWTFKVEDHGPSRPRPWIFKAMTMDLQSQGLDLQGQELDLQGQDHGPGSSANVGPTFSKLLSKILGRFLISGQSLTISGKTLTRHNFTLLINSRFNNNVT